MTTRDELFRAFSGHDVDLNPNVKEVLNYRQALWVGFEAIRKGE